MKALAHAYFKQYAGISLQCWERIGLSLIFAITRGLFFFLSFYFVRDLHMSVASASLAVSAYGLGAAIGGYGGGKLADKFNADAVCIITLLMSVVIFLCFAYARSFDAIMILSLLWGVVAYGFLTANHVWILERTHKHEGERLKILNVIYAVANLGIFITSSIIFFSNDYSFKSIFVVFALLSLLMALWIWIKKERVSADHKTQCSIQSIETEIKSNPNSSNLFVFWLAVITVFFVSLIVTAKSTVYTIYIHQVFPQFDVKGVSFLFALNPLIVALLQTPVVNRFHKKNKVMAMGLGIILMGVGMTMLPFAAYYSFAVIAAIIYVFGEMTFTVLAELVLYQTTPAHKKGQGVGIFWTIYASTMIIGPTLSGETYHDYSGNTVWYACGIISLVFFGLCCFFQKNYHFINQKV